jgi:hypothetical protein
LYGPVIWKGRLNERRDGVTGRSGLLEQYFSQKF